MNTYNQNIITMIKVYTIDGIYDERMIYSRVREWLIGEFVIDHIDSDTFDTLVAYTKLLLGLRF